MKIYLFYINIFLLCLSVSSDTIRTVENLELIDFNNSLIIDGYPIYFTCKFKTSGLNFSIFFKRTEYSNKYFNSYILGDKLSRNQDEFEDHDRFYQTYESVNVKNDYFKAINHSANSIIFVKHEVLQEIKNKYQHADEETLKKWILNSSKNLTNIFNVLLNVYYDDLLISINSHPTEHNDKKINQDYKAYFSRYAFDPKFSANKVDAKRQKRYFSKKNKLTVEVCIHIHEGVFYNAKNYLNTDNVDYIKMYLSLRFAHAVLNLNKIYQRIDHPLFSIKIEFVEMIIHKNSSEHIDKIEDKHSFFAQVKEFINKFYQSLNQTFKCDHVFFLHNYEFGATVGLASVGLICGEGKTSIIKYTSYIENIMAHELAHNLGVNHDGEYISMVNCQYNGNQLMNPAVLYNYSVFTFSDCSIRQMEKSLFDKNMTLLSRYKCLTTKNNPECKVFKKFLDKSKNKLPGLHFSLSDQCRILTNNTKSYWCGGYFVNCIHLYCYTGDKCQHFEGPLDGTACGTGKVCLYFECVDYSLKNYKIVKDLYQDSLRIGDLNNLLEQSSILLRNKCPMGATQENKAFRNLPVDKRLVLYGYNSCDDLLFDWSRSKKNEFCNGELTESICCERCIKYNLNKCPLQEVNKCPLKKVKEKRTCSLPTCENLKKNPCFNKGKCVTNKTLLNDIGIDTAFHCECPKGYKGKLKNLIKTEIIFKNMI